MNNLEKFNSANDVPKAPKKPYFFTERSTFNGKVKSVIKSELSEVSSELWIDVNAKSSVIEEVMKTISAEFSYEYSYSKVCSDDVERGCYTLTRLKA
jgi:hypothetical protein|tara:strand:- start:2 stop:292 length:291 start_codon:yes stop_codon:yes gene_type:complete